MRRSVLHWVCVCALHALPVAGCGDESTGGDTGGSAGTGGTGDGTGNGFPCTERGIRDAIAEGGGPQTFECDGPTTVVTEAEIAIDNDVVLDGEGNLTLDGYDTHRVLSVTKGVTASLRGLTVTGGYDGPGPKSVSNGAGIHNSGTLALTRCTVSGNVIDWGDGGGIYNTGMLALMGSTVSDNSALSPVSQGGGILNSGTLTLANSTVSGNTAAFLDELCSGNSIANWGTLTLVISTLSGEAGPNCLVSNEGTFDVASSIIDGTCEGDVTSNGYNIESPGDTCGFDQSTDQVNVSAGALALQPLADNGGPTETHALGEGSVAIDQIPAEDCVDVEGEPLTTDQRGEPRPGGAMCDVGAFEVQQGSL